MTKTSHATLITTSFELAAERCNDLTPFVYERLFAGYPELRAEFRQDPGNLVKGEMLAQAVNVILDFVGARTYSARMIQCEVVSHAAFGVRPEVFGIFFGVIAATLQNILGADWSAEMDDAWSELLGELDYFVTHPDQRLDAASA